MFLLLSIVLRQEAACQGELNVVDRSVNPGMALDEFDFRSQEVVDYYYYNEEWHMGGIQLKNGQNVLGHHLKFDIYANHLEVRTPQGIKICPNQKIDQFFLITVPANDTLHFVDAKNYTFPDKAPVIGFLQIIQTGSYTLAAHYEAKKKASNYVQALDMGDRREKIVNSETYYIVKDKSVLCKLGNHTKSLDCPALSDIIDDDLKMKTRTVEDKKAFVKYLNNQ